ncbi:hypothetical protein [Posidoniimonas corsicana]|nr:hypothetical protein [Posidoniimonas corsicana]
MESTHHLIRCYAMVALASIAAVGCGDGGPKRVPVSGTVLIDGKPLTVGNVRFVPEGARPSYGQVDDEGRFTLSCFESGDGAVTGLHQVQVSASEIIGGSKVHWHAPAKYADYRSSGLTAEITEPVDNLTIELTWGDPKQKRSK